jgi:hypothetical protein
MSGGIELDPGKEYTLLVGDAMLASFCRETRNSLLNQEVFTS